MASEAGECEGAGCGAWAVPTIAPPPPRPAPRPCQQAPPAPPALLMLLLADMDVVNQVRVPAPRTEPLLPGLLARVAANLPTLRAGGQNSSSGRLVPGSGAGVCGRNGGGEGGWRKGVRPLPQQGLPSLPQREPPEATFLYRRERKKRGLRARV